MRERAKSYFTGSAGSISAKACGDLQGGPQGSRLVVVEAQDAAEPAHVHIHGHDQLGLVDALPQAEVHFVAPDHPAEEQVQPLAGAAPAGVGQKIAQTGGRPCPPCISAQGIAERAQCRQNGGILLVIAQAKKDSRPPWSSKTRRNRSSRSDRSSPVVKRCLKLRSLPGRRRRNAR